MNEPKLEVPAELREMAEKTIDQAEKAFGMFFDAAGKSMASVPSPGTEMQRSITRESWFTPPIFRKPCKFNRNS